MLVIDIIILSFARTIELRSTTNHCLESLFASEDPAHVVFNVFVLESNRTAPPYGIGTTQTIYPTEPFGYNRYLNIGLRLCSNSYVAFCNNDLIFRKGWVSEMLKVAESNPDIMSFCAKDSWLHPQYPDLDLSQPFLLGREKMKYFTGWFFMIRRELIDRIGYFDDHFSFWYCDDDFIKVMEQNHIKNALVTQAVVDHLGSKTLMALDDKASYRRFTTKAWIYFDYKWNHRSKLIRLLKLARYSLRNILHSDRKS